MAEQERPGEAEETALGGFVVLDADGRLPLPKPVLDALGVQPGSYVAVIVAGGRLIVAPTDAELAQLMDETPRALAAAGVSVQDMLDDLPRVREEIMREYYGDAFVDELQRRHVAYRAAAGIQGE